MKRILVIDDEAFLRESVGVALRDRGFEVLEAPDGTSGVDVARKELPDLILCDVKMEGLNGYDTLETLREKPETASIPFILMTGYADPGGMRQGMELGADDYLPKPFSFDSLYAAVDSRLKKLEVIRDHAEQKLSDLRDNISLMLPHELRTPLNGILGYGELLSEDAESLSPEEVREMGQVITDSGRRLERLVENFIIYTQTELFGRDPDKSSSLRGRRCDSARRVAEEQCLRQAEVQGRRMDLQLELGEASVPLTEDHFAKIVAELVQNAFKFSEPGTRVRVRLADEGDSVELLVQDQGRGMSMDQVGHIGAFMQFDRSKQEQQGLGLGLTIARRLVELHRGRLSIRSAAGEGMTVTVRFPKPE